MKIFVLTLLFICFALPVSAQPDFSVEESPSVDDSDDFGYREKTTDLWMIPKAKTGTVSASLVFLTADRAPEVGFEGKRIKFTDVVMTRLGGGYALGRRVQASGGLTLLPKQPSFTDELVVQNGSMGIKIGLIDSLAASLSVGGGSTMEQLGGWGMVSAGLDGRVSIGERIYFEMGLKGLGTALSVEDTTAGFTEIAPSFQVLAQSRYAALWVGSTFAFPLSNHSSTDAELDPRTRVSVQVGGVASFIDDWDLFIVYRFTDRGDIVENPATTLPILDGGFDQQSLNFGLTYRFGGDKR